MRCLEAFLETMGIALTEIEPCEAPGFFGRLDKIRIGIEVTDYHSSERSPDGVDRRVIETDWERLKANIETARESRADLSNVSALLVFDELRVPRGRDSDEFVGSLFEFVEAVIEGISPEMRDFRDFADYPVLRRFLHRLYLSTTEAFVEWEWNHIAGAVGTSANDVCRVIGPKCLHDRPGRVDEFWLLVCGGWYRISQIIGHVFLEDLSESDELREMLEESRFDAVFIYDPTEDRVLQWSKGEAWRIAAGSEGP